MRFRQDIEENPNAAIVFDDPVAYLAELGIEAEIIAWNGPDSARLPDAA